MIGKNDFKELMEIIHFTEKVSTSVHGHNEKEIFSIIKKAFRKSKKYYISIMKLTEDKSSLTLTETTFTAPENQLINLEKMAHATLLNFKIDLKKSSLYSRAIDKKEAFCIKGEEVFKDLFPSKLAVLLTGMTGYKHRNTIIAPLIVHNNVSGVIAISSPVFSEYFIPTVVHFTRHISNAIELSLSERKYRDLIENINEIVISIDTRGIIQYISPQIRAFGKTPDKYINQPIFNFIYPDDRERILIEFKKSMTTGAEFPTEFRIQTEDGEIFWFEDFGRIQYNEAGKITGLTGILRNITEKKKNEQAIRRLTLAIEQSNDCIAIHRFDGIVHYANTSFLETFQYSQDDLNNGRIKVYNSEKDYKRYLEWMEEIKKKGSWSGKIKSRKKDGIIFHSYMSAKIIHNEKDEPCEILAIMKDMTEFYRQKADLEMKNIALKEILSQIEMEKKNIKDEIIRNIDKVVMPAMNHLKNYECITGELKDYIDKIKTDLRNITSSLISKNPDVFAKLSPRQFEICNMAKNGMKNREIAAILNITLQTVERHKKNIRKKLGISGQKINLRTFLERL